MTRCASLLTLGQGRFGTVPFTLPLFSDYDIHAVLTSFHLDTFIYLFILFIITCLKIVYTLNYDKYYVMDRLLICY